MAEECVIGRCTKEGRPCPVCGGEVPPPLGCKPRKYCSKRCLVAHHDEKKRSPGPRSCEDCGRSISQPSGKGRKRVICGQCYIQRKKTANIVTCVACGSAFRSQSKEAMYCSSRCRWPRRLAEKTCDACGVVFKQKRGKQMFCSVACVAAASGGKRGRKRRVYQCIHCGRPFNRHLHRTANKYCSRECAFARRRVQSEGDSFAEMLSWFANWNLDASCVVAPRPYSSTSHKARCKRYGLAYEPIDRLAVFRSANWACKICGCGLLRKYACVDGKVDPRSPTIDCIIPLSAAAHSPGYVYENVQAACHACNVKKADSFAARKATAVH